MKHFLLTIFIGISCGALAQCPPKNITTNPDAPSNEEFPDFRNDFFDWRATSFPTNSTYNPNPVLSPFQNSLTLPEFYQSKDMRPEDGWELIRHNMGQDPVTGGIELTDHVFMILYNKYTAILRVMLAGKDQAYTGASITVKFSANGQKATNLLSNSSEFMALDAFKASPKLYSTARYVNGVHNWFFADFHMTYDLCTCQIDSKLEVNVDLITDSSITLTGTLDGTITSIQGKTNGDGVKHDGFSVDALVDEGKKAMKRYKDLEGFTSDLFKAEAVNNESGEQVKDAVNATGESTYDAPTSKIDFYVDQVAPQPVVAEYTEKKEKINKVKEGLQALAPIAKIVPYVGTAFELVDFFVGGGKKGSPAAPIVIAPMAINAAIELKGNITTSYHYKDITLYTPGSLGSSNPALPDFYPYYNEVLGVFNLMKTPTIYYADERFEESSGNPSDIYAYWYRKYLLRQLQLPKMIGTEQNIQYVLNPAAKLNASTIKIYGQLLFYSATNPTKPMLSSPVVPIEALSNFKTSTGYEEIGDYYTSTIFSLGCVPEISTNVKLKLFVGMTPLNPGTSDVLFVATYPVNVVYNPNFMSTSNALDQCLISENENLSGRSVTQSISAWNTITIGPNVTFGSSPITLKAPAVTVLPGVTIPPNVTITGAYPVPGSTYIDQPTTAQVTTFCEGTYRNMARGVGNGRVKAADKFDQTEKSEREEFVAFPNPAEGSVTFKYYHEGTANIQIKISDMSGSVISDVFTLSNEGAGVYERIADVSVIKPGMYIVVLQINAKKIIKKLVIK
jgi:hypothetical protein